MPPIRSPTRVSALNPLGQRWDVIRALDEGDSLYLPTGVERAREGPSSSPTPRRRPRTTVASPCSDRRTPCSGAGGRRPPSTTFPYPSAKPGASPWIRTGWATRWTSPGSGSIDSRARSEAGSSPTWGPGSPGDRRLALRDRDGRRPVGLRVGLLGERDPQVHPRRRSDPTLGRPGPGTGPVHPARGHHRRRPGEPLRGRRRELPGPEVRTPTAPSSPPGARWATRWES